MTIRILPEVTVLFILLFGRLGAMVMLLPTLGEQAVPVRFRLALALVLTLIFYPIVSTTLPQGLQDNTPALLAALGREVLIGLALGLVARLALSVAQIAGTAVAANIGLSFAQSVDPTMGQQGAIIASFLSVTGLTLVFVTDLHHVAIAGIAESYRMFPPGGALPIADFRDAALMAVAESFKLGIQIAAPFLLFGLVFNLGLGVLQKLMPQLQVFFLAMPVSIGVGLILFALLIGTMTTTYVEHVRMVLMRFIGP
ncbi:flagellar biosynthetic protein FliR [Chthonobacter rhizosphaerae]|uniref:flagellar biosynthetic protein FliR n=1 Tax=Chthonobacter rhizosphaerae TaxID=2735553 RepID=UPI0015EF0EED|nr:flagellar biosynthetic protein FliR [Chthonobacter rhizosphaerae]